MEDLAIAHVRGVRLARRLMVVQERADVLEVEAEVLLEAARTSGGDDAAIDRAVCALAAADEARDEEQRATRLWALHVERVNSLVLAATRIGAEHECPHHAGTLGPGPPAPPGKARRAR